MDKKILVILAIFALFAAAAGFWIYRIQPQNQTKKTEDAQVELKQGGVKAEGASGKGMLFVCQDKCGDNVCQKPDPDCGKNGELNCVCPETKQDCPGDCK